METSLYYLKSLQVVVSVADPDPLCTNDLRRNEDVKATKAQLCAIVDRRNKIAHEADLDPGNPGERWPIDRPLVEEAIDFIESTIRAIYEVAGPART